jgi:hypothetical protein
MSWGSSIFVGVVTAAVGAVAAGFVATLAVGWYRISSFEAGSAVFVVGFGILGLVAGLIIGIVASRVIAGGADPGMLKALGASHGVLLGIIAVVGVAARLIADVPPTIGGEKLMLAVEVRWPEGTTTSPATIPGEPHIQLGSVNGAHTLRASSRGPLWTQDAHQVDGRWVAPGAVDIFTTRGSLVMNVVLDTATTHGFLLPLSGRPRSGDMQWTEWYPRAKPGAPPLPNGFTYRYRVQKRSEPVRTETIGPFEVQTIASGFFDEAVDGKTVLAASARFRISHRGRPVTVEPTSADSLPAGVRLDLADGVALVSGPQPALLAHFTTTDHTSGPCYVLAEESGSLRSIHVPDCRDAAGSILTSDAAVFRAGARGVPSGRINRVSFERPGMYVVGGSILDTRRLAVHAYAVPETFSAFPAVAPLGISPDERSIVLFGSSYDGDNHTMIAVTDFVGNRSYLLPVDEARMRYATFDAIDPPWLMHHFEWRKGADGADSLVERTGFTPMPYHGRYAMPDSYWLEPAREGLREAVMDFIVSEFKGERVPVDSFAYERPIRIDGKIVNVAFGGTGSYVSVSLPSGATDMTLLETIAHRLDAALATGRYDSLFTK